MKFTIEVFHQEAHGHRFNPYTGEGTFNKVYTFRGVDIEYGSPLDEVCEDIFKMLNTAHPADYKARSLSVGDVILFHGAFMRVAYAVDSFGFERVWNFLPEGSLPEVEAEAEEVAGLDPVSLMQKVFEYASEDGDKLAENNKAKARELRELRKGEQ